MNADTGFPRCMTQGGPCRVDERNSLVFTINANVRVVIEDQQSAHVLAEIRALKETVMTKFDDITAKLGAINGQTTRMGEAQAEQSTAIANIAADIVRVKEQLSGGLTPAEADQAIAALDTAIAGLASTADSMATTAEQLKGVAAEFPEPTPSE